MELFRRIQLAKTVVESMLGAGISADGANGVFLAGPRRTGKTTFLRSDLIPELEARGVVVVYVDLWSDKEKDPADLIRTAIVDAITRDRGILGAMADLMPAEIGAAGVSVKKGAPKDRSQETLSSLLSALQRVSGRRVAVIVDEAQQALKSAAGDAAMFALKSARDTINTPGDPRLLLVMTGSDRDKLLRLVYGHGAPFLGCQVHAMPPLGRDFVDFVSDQLDAAMGHKVNREVLTRALQIMGNRPQFLGNAVGAAANPLGNRNSSFEDRVLAYAIELQEADKDEMLSTYQSLVALEQAVIWRILATKEKFRAYDAPALAFYSKVVGSKVTAAMVQNALTSLRDKDTPIIWRSQRGEYAMEDSTMQTWYEELVAAGSWPPAEEP